MQKLSFKKLSILSLVLIAASAVTSAFTTKSDDKANLGANDGTVVATGDGFTCAYVGDGNGNCYTSTDDQLTNDPDTDSATGNATAFEETEVTI